jgi:hypothetical protein
MFICKSTFLSINNLLSYFYGVSLNLHCWPTAPPMFRYAGHAGFGFGGFVYWVRCWFNLHRLPRGGGRLSVSPTFYLRLVLVWFCLSSPLLWALLDLTHLSSVSIGVCVSCTCFLIRRRQRFGSIYNFRLQFRHRAFGLFGLLCDFYLWHPLRLASDCLARNGPVCLFCRELSVCGTVSVLAVGPFSKSEFGAREFRHHIYFWNC